MNLNQLNIDNLTGLWRLMGTTNTPDIGPMSVSTSTPNRCWLDWQDEYAELAPELIGSLPAAKLVTVWRAKQRSEAFEAALVDNDFKLAVEQTAMYLDLAAYEPSEIQPLTIETIHSREDIGLWTDIASEAFAYLMDKAVTKRISNNKNIHLILARQNGEAVATALLYRTGPVVGIHQVGVPKRFRGKGYAFSLMQQLLVLCQDWQSKIITLQASNAGKGMYLKLGFKSQFTIGAYRK